MDGWGNYFATLGKLQVWNEAEKYWPELFMFSHNSWYIVSTLFFVLFSLMGEVTLHTQNSTDHFTLSGWLCAEIHTPKNYETSLYSESEKWKVLIAQLCLTLCNPMDCSPPGSSIHGILQARTLEWIAVPFSRGSSQPRDWTLVSCIAGRLFIVWATREAPLYFNGAI